MKEKNGNSTKTDFECLEFLELSQFLNLQDYSSMDRYFSLIVLTQRTYQMMYQDLSVATKEISYSHLSVGFQ